MLQVDMPGGDSLPMTVTRPHVTTPSTAKASHDRRKQPANFACPVPGCGSTFTRHFNLKGESAVSVVSEVWWLTEFHPLLVFLSVSFVFPPVSSRPFRLVATHRPPAIARGGEALSVQVAGVRQGFRATARLQAARAAAPQHPPVPLRRLQEELRADGRAQPAS